VLSGGGERAEKASCKGGSAGGNQTVRPMKAKSRREESSISSEKGGGRT